MSNCRYQKHGTQESDTKALGNCIYTLLSPQTLPLCPLPWEGLGGCGDGGGGGGGTSQAFNVVLHVSFLPASNSQMQQLRHREVQQLAQSHTANRCKNGVQGIWLHILQGPRISSCSCSNTVTQGLGVMVPCCSDALASSPFLIQGLMLQPQKEISYSGPGLAWISG